MRKHASPVPIAFRSLLENDFLDDFACLSFGQVPRCPHKVDLPDHTLYVVGGLGLLHQGRREVRGIDSQQAQSLAAGRFLASSVLDRANLVLLQLELVAVAASPDLLIASLFLFVDCDAFLLGNQDEMVADFVDQVTIVTRRLFNFNH